MTLAVKIKFRDRAEAAYLKAFDASGYSVGLGGGSSRGVSRQALNDLHEKFLYWDTEVERAQATKSGMKVRYGTGVE